MFKTLSFFEPSPPNLGYTSGRSYDCFSQTYANTLFSRFGQRYQKASDSSDVIVTHQRIPRSTAVSTLECVVCADTKDAGGFPRFSITATCTHVSNTCLDCIQLSIESDLSSKLWTEIRCPECRELLEYADIQRYANQQTFAKYDQKTSRPHRL